MEELAKSDGSFKISDILGGDFKADGEKQASNAGTGKPLYIKDFVSNNRIVPNDTDEKEIFSGNGSTMVMRSQNTKVRPENVTIPQWVSANMRILKALVERGDIASMESMFDYRHKNRENKSLKIEFNFLRVCFGLYWAFINERLTIQRIRIFSLLDKKLFIYLMQNFRLFTYLMFRGFQRKLE